MRQAWRLLGTVLAFAACRPPSEPAPRTLVHRLTRPEDPSAVRLNEDLVFHFSGEIDRTSVTHDCVRITDAQGRPARGRLDVDGTRVRFVPATVLAPDLSDGGYVPGATYQVEIAGFPRPDGLRGVDGAPLASTYRWSFRVVEVANGGGPFFEDRDPDRVRPLRLFPAPQSVPKLRREEEKPSGGTELRYELGPLDAIYLRCEEPLDPSSLVDGAFALRSRQGLEVRLRPRLLENEPDAALRPRPSRARSSSPPEAWQRELRAALVELAPVTRLSSGLNSPWSLVFYPEVRTTRVVPVAFLPGFPALPVLVPHFRSGAPRDLGGHPVWEPALVQVSFSVVERDRDGGRGAWLEEFVDTRLRSTLAIPGADGTATWSDSGRVEVRFPKAAGDGRQLDVELGGPQTFRDLHSVRAFVPPGRTCTLNPNPGPVVVRAQGSLRIAGRLERATTGRSTFQFGREKLSAWIDRALAVPADVAARELDWTVLVAGGDLVVEGEIDVSTPILLVAGGRIRVTGTVRGGQPTQVFRLGEGGGAGLAASNVEDLELDAPEQNPLRSPLRFAVLSGPLPPRGTVVEWLEAEAHGSDERKDVANRGWTVRYLPELARAPLAPEDLQPVDSPELLEKPGSIQLLIEIAVEPGGRWRPPFVDSVRLAWRESGGGER